MIQNQFDLLVSSNPSLGAKNVSSDGSTFQIQVPGGLNIPSNAFNVQTQVVSADLWHNSFNIKDDKNTITINSTDYTVPAGLYDGNTIGDAILSLTDKITSIEPNEATGKMEIVFADTATIDLKDTGIIMGFSSVITGNKDDIFISDIEPSFNSINYWLIQSDIIDTGIPINGTSIGIIAKIISDASPNKQVLYEPTNPALISSNSLSGSSKSIFNFSLLDDKLNKVDTRGEYYALQLRISYYEPSDSNNY